MDDAVEAARKIVNETRYTPTSKELLIARALLSSRSEVDRLREALGGIRYHAENQDMSHLTFRIKALECAELALSPQPPKELS